ncbi:MAG TPA: protein DpdJ [Azoarcus taiwanensis]|nr:protein DpdJ [Azoarcus taiwanensis]
MHRDELIGELLTCLERAEVRLMEWGFTDVSHTRDEVVNLFASHPTLGTAFRDLAVPSGEGLWVDDLVSAGLLYRVSFGPPPTYRSRFAESARLLVKLRQRFRDNDWSTAPELVSDVRFHLGPRRFPVRNIDSAAAWQSLSSLSWRPELQRAVLEALCGGPGDGLRLAGFQLRASQRILEHYRGTERATGTVITAGTGGGKTKAFYIPALMGIAADVAGDSTAATRVLSVYPRNVLLADQFAEATRLAMTVSAQLRGNLTRQIRVGALIGDVPLTPDFEGDSRNRYQIRLWPRPKGVAGHRVPHLRDPSSGKPLVWLDKDRRAGRTVLRLEDDANQVVVPDGVVVLTRRDLLARPPDILLTSIEMINKELSSEVGREVLGFGTGRCPLKLVLLDEIHTYEGLTGAQVPWILRRLAYWTRGQRRPPSIHVVGLSATLQDAPNHLAMLSGIPDGSIVEICPDASVGELTTEGQEYNVVLKSHPGSGAGVLATSIQTVMLGARLLTPRGHVARIDAIDASHFFGRKLFGFTDNLDVVNRWLPDFCDAEQTRGLARLRKSQDGDDARWLAGQSWRLSEQLKHDLGQFLLVGRTSSQDPGVDANADVVLATSALEVGFDDDEVGMVVQHKAPQSAASFLQRKGRAGRRQGMRPWTVVVLSEHGRDRWAFRDSERLFSPSLDRLSVPVFNPYVLRIQATWFLVDWIARLVGHGVPSLYLARRDYFDRAATQVVRDLIDKPEMRSQLTRDLADWIRFAQGGVRVTDADGLAQDLLWKPPRAVLRQVVPVLWNHLEGDAATASTGRQRLLPQFLPERTWEVLDTQDVELALPNGEDQTMDVRRALRECVPGRVSRRYAIGRNEPSKWLAWSVGLLDSMVPETAAAETLLDEFVVNEDLDGLSIFQPTRLVLTDVPPAVKKSSNAEWLWTCKVQAAGESGYLTLHTGPIARSIFDSGSSWLHRERSWLRVYRYSSSVRYELLMERSDTRRGVLRVVQPAGCTSTRHAAVGFVRSVDGVALRVREDVLRHVPDLSADVAAALRPVYFRCRAMQSEVLRQATSVFGTGLLVTSALGMAVATALRQHVPLSEAWSLIANKSAAAKKVLSSVLAGDVEDDYGDSGSPGRGIQEVIALWGNPTVAAEMDALVTCLWNEPGEDWQRWLRAVLLETIRSAVEVAVQSVLPEVPENDFSVEVIDEEGRASIWILEAEAGGIGVIDRLLAETTSDPNLFDTALESSLTTCAAERIVENVARAVGASLRRFSDLNAAFAEVRVAGSYAELDAARDALMSALSAAGCDADKEAVTALVGKALMPGSSTVTDHWMRRLTAGRRAAIDRLGIAIDPRLWAYWTTTSPKRRSLMAATLSAQHGQQPSDAQVTASVVRLTLDPCRDSCPECLGAAREMHGLLPSRRLARHWLNLSRIDEVIDVATGAKWLQELDEVLARASRVRLRFVDTERDQVGLALAERLAHRYDRGYALSGFRVAAVTRHNDGWELLIRIDDMEVD